MSGFLREVKDMEEAEEIEESTNSCSTSTSSSASVRGKKHCTEMRSEKPVYLRQKGTTIETYLIASENLNILKFLDDSNINRIVKKLFAYERQTINNN